MKLLTIQRYEDPMNLTTVFKVYFFKWCFFTRILTDYEKINKIFPKSLKFIKWFREYICFHSWEKIGNPFRKSLFLGDINYYYQKIKCKKCERNNEYLAYESEF